MDKLIWRLLVVALWTVCGIMRAAEWFVDGWVGVPGGSVSRAEEPSTVIDRN